MSSARSLEALRLGEAHPGYPPRLASDRPDHHDPGVDAQEPRLALIAPTFTGPSETFIHDHVRTLAPGRTVLVSRDSLGAEVYGCPILCQVQPEDGVRHGIYRSLRFRLRRRFGQALSFEDRQRVAAFFREHRVGWVLAEFGGSGVQVADVCAELRIPLYVYFRGHDATASLAFASTRRRYRRMFRQVRGVFCVSRDLASRLVGLGCPPHLIHVNPSGVEIPDFPPGRPEAGRLIAVGRLVDKKGPLHTIEAFGRIAARFPQATLDVVGDGPLMARCRELVAAHGLGDRVTLHGTLRGAAIRPLLRRAAIFVQHSVVAANGDTEGFPTAIAEAMSTALPVVSTRHAGIPEHVLDGVTGTLVEEGDVAAMADALAALLEDPEKAARMGAAGRRHALAHLNRADTRRRIREVIGLPEPV